jgi:translation initiation factor 1
MARIRKTTPDGQPVYSTGAGRISSPRPAPAPAGPAGVPQDGVVRVSRTKAGRKGRTVTLVTGIPAADLDAVGKELKRVCGSGGAVKDGVVEVQGDHRERVIAHLQGRYRVKAAGG